MSDKLLDAAKGILPSISAAHMDYREARYIDTSKLEDAIAEVEARQAKCHHGRNVPRSSNVPGVIGMWMEWVAYDGDFCRDCGKELAK